MRSCFSERLFHRDEGEVEEGPYKVKSSTSSSFLKDILWGTPSYYCTERLTVMTRAESESHISVCCF